MKDALHRHQVLKSPMGNKCASIESTHEKHVSCISQLLKNTLVLKTFDKNNNLRRVRNAVKNISKTQDYAPS